jgi:alginate O-acetyltransferase complex protein AlgI
MLFNSSEFVILTFATFAIYYLPFMLKWQRHLLVLSSFVFYGFNNPVLLILFIISLYINSTVSFVVMKTDFERKKLLTTAGVALNIGILCAFKYSPLFAKTLLSDFGEGSFGELLISIPLPIGISFYTFQGISLVLDVWWGKNSKKVKSYISDDYWTHLLNSFLFISFFPQLIAGPILKSGQFIPQIKEKFLNEVNWSYVLHYIILGYFFKTVIADNIGYVTSYVEFPNFISYSGISLILFMIGYALQLFADFAGYSFIALGLGELFGYKLIKNFNYPYIASTFSEYWKRWHITLYDWFNYYVYNTFTFTYRYWGKWVTFSGIILVFGLSGIWHGASWNFGVWGLMHGFILILEILIFNKIKIKQTNFIKGFKILFVFSYVLFSYVFFKFSDMEHIKYFFQAVYNNWGFSFTRLRLETLIILFGSPIVLYHIYYFINNSFRQKYINPLKPYLYGLMIVAMIFDMGSSKEFIYFQF